MYALLYRRVYFLFILKFANSVNLGYAHFYYNQFFPTPDCLLPYRHSVFYIPIRPYPSRLPLPDVCFSIVYKSRTYCLTLGTLRFSFSYISLSLSPYSSLTLTDVVSSPATETCGLSLVSSPHLRADGLLPAATKPAQPR